MIQGTLAIFIAIAFGVAGIAFVIWQVRNVMAEDTGNDRMREIAAAIQEGAAAFLNREYSILSGFVVVVAAVIAIFLGWQAALCFVAGAATSAAAGYLGMWVAVRANVRTTAAAQRSLSDGLRVAFSSGSVMGIAVVSFAILGLTVLYLVFDGNIQYIAGFGFGASSIALFARVGGGIYTKAADIGADLVGKLEESIPEDDPRNPAVIADNVGDNVGDVAGMGADLFESYSGSIIAAATLGAAIAAADGAFASLIVLPFLVAGVGILSALIGVFLVKTPPNAAHQDLLSGLRRGIWGASGIVLALSAVVVPLSGTDFRFWFVILAGLIAGNGIAWLTEYYTYGERSTQGIARTAETGAATLLIQGLSVGMMSTVGSVLLVAGAILLAFYLGAAVRDMTTGLYAVALAAVGMLSTLGVTLASDAYGSVADNAGGIAEMSGLPGYVRERTDALDKLGNTTAATGKGFAIGSAVLTALALMAAYVETVRPNVAATLSLDLLDATMLPGILIGAVLPFLFTALTMTAVGKVAYSIVHEVRRQFREIAGLREGAASPDFRACVDISTKGALREMLLPGTLAVVAPLAVGYILGAEALAGMLVGAIASGFTLAVMMVNAGAAWDNAKKWIESGQLGGKGSDAHKAAIVGDTVGDPFKDTSGPSLNILIKLMSIVSLVFAGTFGSGPIF
jgi:K(+)-stimulated pyrophosphate-energized sodium pump